MANIREKWREFREWQQRPHEVAPLSEAWHECKTCGQRYQGNYCPRCGQSAKIGRYSFKNAMLLFLDVWGLGNRGMFRTLRDLLLRPGYMIRDYLKGMQMAYFPPFKLFFLLTTLSLLVESGMNLERKNYFDASREQIAESFARNDNPDVQDDPQAVQAVGKLQHYGMKIMDYAQRFPNLWTLSALFLLSGFLYIFFRKCPNIPDLRFSEFLVALVYTSDMFSIYNTVMEFFGTDIRLQYFLMLLPLIPLKQMSGFKWWKLIGIMLLTLLMFFITIAVGSIAVMATAFINT